MYTFRLMGRNSCPPRAQTLSAGLWRGGGEGQLHFWLNSKIKQTASKTHRLTLRSFHYRLILPVLEMFAVGSDVWETGTHTALVFPDSWGRCGPWKRGSWQPGAALNRCGTKTAPLPVTVQTHYWLWDPHQNSYQILDYYIMLVWHQCTYRTTGTLTWANKQWER